MQKENKQVSRKRFLSWGIGVTSLLTIPAFLRLSKPKKETKQVKMLAQDGSLVYVNAENIPKKKTQIRKADIHTWISKR